MLKYLRVMVPYYIPIAILGVITGAVLTIGDIPDIRIIYALISISFIVGGFNTLNGVFDAEIDSVNKPHRPIPRGEISKKAGFFYAWFLYTLGIVFSLFVNFHFMAIILLSILLTAFYSLPFIRLRSKFIINTLTGLVFYGILCPLAGWALYPAFPIPILLITFLFLLGSGIAITKDFEDIYGDRMYHIKTLPETIGVERTTTIITFLILSSFIYLALISLINLVNIRYLAVLIFIPWALYTVYRLESRNNNRMFFVKSLLLAISVELFIIVVTLI